jgi:hypothetical protein
MSKIHPLYDLNSTEWVQDEVVNYYYYKDVLEPDEISEILFDSVTCTEPDETGHLEIQVLVDGIAATDQMLEDSWGVTWQEINSY